MQGADRARGQEDLVVEIERMEIVYNFQNLILFHIWPDVRNAILGRVKNSTHRQSQMANHKNYDNSQKRSSPRLHPGLSCHLPGIIT
ncbi:MAG: hypothetical protein WBF31_10670, partial [Anaerolineae bacterium]